MPSARDARRSLALSALAALLGAGACGGEGGDGEGRGTVVVAVAADADFLLPVVVDQLVGKQVFDQVYDPLAVAPATMNTVGDAGFEPRLASRWTWSADSLSIAFALDPRARWHDGRPVRASDVRFSVGLIKDSLVASRLAGPLADVDSVSATDSLTAVVWFSRRTPEQFFNLVNNVPVMPEHVLAGIPRDKLRESDAARNPVGSGRFRFRRWVPGSRIEVVADTANYRGRPSIDRVIWSVSPDPTSLWARLVNEEADLVEVLRGEPLSKVAAAPMVRTVPYNGLDYAFITFNVRADGEPSRPHPILADPGVRRALAMAVDRNAVIRNVFDSLAVAPGGPFVRAQWTADSTLTGLPFDADRARALLDSLGWRDANGDGVREKGGRRLAFSLAFPTSSVARRQSSVLVQSQWKEVGADVRLDDLENNTFGSRLMGGRFDAMFGGSHADPSPSEIRQTYGSRAREGAGNANYGGYSNPSVDALIDSAVSAFDPQRSREYYRRLYALIVEDVPAIFMYEPKLVAGIHRRIDTGTLRNDGWWMNLADWKIDPAQRIARDRIPLSASLPAPGDSTTGARQ